MPSLGEEGIEYEDVGAGTSSDSQNQSPAETRNVDVDLKLHAPRPSLPSSSAKAKVQAVTRTDSHQAAAAGIESAGSLQNDENERPNRLVQSRADSRADSASSSRPQSPQLNERHTGQRVPMAPNAGDVQAPSPTPNLAEFGPNHHRTRSGRESYRPPGLHPDDQFEKAWYEKHPEEYAREKQTQFDRGVGPRPDWALSSDDLNKIVRRSAINGTGLGEQLDIPQMSKYPQLTVLGTSPAVTGTPEEELGYLAADQYTRRLASPPADSHRDSHASVESPLRNMNMPAADSENREGTPMKADAEHERPHGQSSEGPGVIHVDDPYHPMHHPDGFAPTPDLDAQYHGKDDDVGDEPILAADEVRPESAGQHPAVPLTYDIRETPEHEGMRRTPSARPTSGHGSTRAQASYNSHDEREQHAALEDVKEYEPLFPEDDAQEPVPIAERFKQRPGMVKHRFPSEDLWEDAPDSAHLQATVMSPDLPKQDTFETPEQEAARKSQTEHVDPHEVAAHILESEDHHQKAPARPEMTKQRFPSRDIWEDAPDSQKLVTTIEPPAIEPSQEDAKSPIAAKSPNVPAKPSIPPRPARRPQGPPVDTSSKPSISPTEKRPPPTIPDKPKPQIPVRPAKPPSRDSSETITKVLPAESPSGGEQTKDAPAVPTKEKPAVPSRPGGSKIAALKAGFLTDLNSRLQDGPQGPKPKEQEKKEEPPAEKGPLNDARKGRARGPARRRPAVQKPANEPATAKLPPTLEVRITEVWNVWQIDEAGDLVVPSAATPKTAETAAPDAPVTTDSSMTPEISKNLAGESTDPKPILEKEESLPSASGKVEPIEPEPTKLEEVAPAAPTAEPTEPERTKLGEAAPTALTAEPTEPELTKLEEVTSPAPTAEPTEPEPTKFEEAAPTVPAVEPTEPEASKPDNGRIPSATSEQIDILPAAKESPSLTAAPSEEKTQAGLTTEPATEAADAKPDIESEAAVPRTDNTSSARDLDDTVERMAASADGKRYSDGDVHTPQQSAERSPKESTS